MEVDLGMVRRVFRDLLEGRMTREAADRWAHAVVLQSEAGTLTCSPPTDEGRIWEGIMYLYGIDTMTSPGEYLHTSEDIQQAMSAKVGS